MTLATRGQNGHRKARALSLTVNLKHDCCVCPRGFFIFGLACICSYVSFGQEDQNYFHPNCTIAPSCLQIWRKTKQPLFSSSTTTRNHAAVPPPTDKQMGGTNVQAIPQKQSGWRENGTNMKHAQAETRMPNSLSLSLSTIQVLSYITHTWKLQVIVDLRERDWVTLSASFGFAS